MTYISEVPEEKADANLRQIYAQIREEFGFLPHFWQAQGSRADIVRVSLELWRLIYRTGALPSALKEEIGQHPVERVLVREPVLFQAVGE